LTLENWASVATIGGTVLVVPQIIIGVWSIVRSNRRARVKSTLDYYESVNQAIKLPKKELKDRYGPRLDRDTSQRIHEEGTDVPLVNKVLNAYERFALGTNEGVYDLRIVNRLCGTVLIENYRRFRDYIDYRRELLDHPNAWRAFEQLVRRIRKMRG